jgi:hypothetical protein
VFNVREGLLVRATVADMTVAAASTTGERLSLAWLGLGDREGGDIRLVVVAVGGRTGLGRGSCVRPAVSRVLVEDVGRHGWAWLVTAKDSDVIFGRLWGCRWQWQGDKFALIQDVDCDAPVSPQRRHERGEGRRWRWRATREEGA